MTDNRTRQAIDALAAMLLTGPEGSGPTQVDAGAASSSHDAPPTLRIAGRGPHDEMAMDDEIDTIDFDRPAANPGAVEAVLLGHLPGYASPWVSQYAAELAQRHQGAALLRVAADAVELELFDAAFDDDADLTVGRIDQAAGLGELVEMLHDAGSSVGAYLVLLDQPQSATQRERLAAIAKWTVLTGANDAAVVGCYRMLKTQLAGSDARPQVALAFMGCEAEDAQRAADRINRAAAEFLHAPVTLQSVQKRMKPVRRHRVGRFECNDPGKLWAALSEFILPDATVADDADVDSPEISETLYHDPFIDEPLIDDVSEAPAEAMFSLEPEFGSEPIVDDVEAPVAEEVAAPVEPSPEPIAAVESEPEPEPVAEVESPAALLDEEEDDTNVTATEPTPDADDLTQYVPDTTALEARCPRHPDVLIAVDAAGRLHLMLHQPADAPGAPGAVAALLQTRSWLAEHRALVALTDPQRRTDAAADPIAHLFTAEPAAAAEHIFAAAPDARPFRLHMLCPVTVAGHTAYAHAVVG